MSGKKLPWNVADAARHMRIERDRRGWSTTDLADRARGIALEQGSNLKLTQQTISNFEQPGKAKRMPEWFRYVESAFEASDDETDHDPYLSTGKTDAGVMIRLVPTHAGLGPGGTGEGDEGEISFSRDLVLNELKADPETLLAIVAEGNSMEPDFLGGDQILVDTRRKTLASPGAFCIWDGDGHVIKYLQKIHGSEPPQARVISRNTEIYPEPETRLIDEMRIVGRVVWFGRRVQ